MAIVVRTTIAADPDRVWAVLSDLRAWPEWTPTVTSVDSPVPTPATGAEVVVKQPGRRAVTYLIEAVADGRSFRWGNSAAGVRQWADHTLEPAGRGATEVVLEFGMSGWLAAPLAAVARSRIRRMVQTEADSLKRRVEEGPALSGGSQP